MAFSDNCAEDDIPRFVSWTTVVISSLLCVLTVPVNMLTCIAIIKDPFKDLRTPFNYFIINLAVADLVIGFVTLPSFIIYHSWEAIEGKKLSWIWVFHLTYFMSLTASLLSLSALAVDRCRTVTSTSCRRLKPIHGYLTSALIWCLSLILPLIYLLIEVYLFIFVFSNTSAIVVFAILLASHKSTSKTMQSHVKNWDTIKHSDFKRRTLARERKVTRSFLTILTVFCSTVFPSCIAANIISFCTTCSCDITNTLRDVYFLLPMIIAATNQLLYSMRMRNFRRAYVYLFQHTVFSQKIRSRKECYRMDKIARGNKETGQ